jgi:hypothetical protein
MSKEDYEPVATESVPEGLKWKPSKGAHSKTQVTLFSFGNIYKLVRSLETGAAQYFKLKGSDVAKSPAEKIDAEPGTESGRKKEQVRYRVGCKAWFLDTGNRWYLIEVVARIGENRETFGEPKRIIIKSATGMDADKRTPWPYGAELEFPAKPDNALFMRLRPLKARYQ